LQVVGRTPAFDWRMRFINSKQHVASFNAQNHHHPEN
jgi:hypothetical protein